jgi:hypothetical protein
VALPVDAALARFKDFVMRGYDDLDEYDGADFILDKKYFIAVRHYRGHSNETTTIYIDRKQSDIDMITHVIHQIHQTLTELDIPPMALQWERKRSPEW